MIDSEGKKLCPTCKKRKLASEFHRSKTSSDGRQGYCSSCSCDRFRKWRSDNLEKANASLRERKKKPEIKVRINVAQRKYNREISRFKRYGLTKNDYLALIEKQESKCVICLGNFDWDNNPAYIDHDHITGIVRGLLCSSCNKGLGHFYDDPASLSRAIEYLKKAAG